MGGPGVGLERNIPRPIMNDITELEGTQIRSWFKPANIPRLLGRKKVDWSVFEYGTHIPMEFHESFEKANAGTHLERGQSHDMKLIIDDKGYEATLQNIDRKGSAIDTLQIRYDNNHELKGLFRKLFEKSYLYLQEERAQKPNGDKTHIKTPEDLAEFIDFYQTDVPFEYRLEPLPSQPLGKRPTIPNVWWVNQGKTLEVERKEGILWAPIKSSDDKTLYHWETMKEVKEGDIIAHYANGAIRYVSKVIAGAVDAPKPGILKDESWDERGRLVRTSYHQLDKEISLQKFSKQLLDLNIDQGPLDRKGNVKQGYLFRLGLEGLRVIQSAQPEVHWPDFAVTHFEDHPSYWVFQGNPKIFNIVDALRNGHVKWWSVEAHKKEIKKGDKFILWATGKKPGCYGLGTVASDVYRRFDDDIEMKYYVTERENIEKDHCELYFDVILVENPILKEEIEANPILKNLKAGIQGTNFSATQEEYTELLRIATERFPIANKKPEVLAEPYTLDDFVSDTGFDRHLIEDWVTRLRRKKHIIIQGPPGTGKTYVAERLARLLVSGTEGFWEVVQFHPTYAYEDFIQGVRPRLISGNISWELQDGRFLQFSKRARTIAKRPPCLLIIDEINRAHLSKVFGELMYLLEYRDKEIPLASGGELFRVPTNVYIIGTMNTADRSIALVDHALRRRFSFIRLSPNYDVLTRHLDSKGYPASGLVSLLKEINKAIDDPNYEIGISYFLKDDDLKEAMRNIWVGEIEPYLEEFFYDQPEKVEPFRWTSLIKRQLQEWI